MRVLTALLALALRGPAGELPAGVSVDVTCERTEFAMGDPILVDVVYRNEGDETCMVPEPLVSKFYDLFEVRDSAGAELPDPVAHLEDDHYSGPVRRHELPPGETVTLRKYVNESAAFDKPGEYVVRARGYMQTIRDQRLPSRCPGKPLKIRILPAPDRKACDAIIEDLKALWRDPRLREREQYASYRPFVTESADALRLLAYRRDPALLLFWIEAEGKNAPFAQEALVSLPDRAAVLEALEERLGRDDGDRFYWLYARLAVPKTDDIGWDEVSRRRRAILDMRR